MSREDFKQIVDRLKAKYPVTEAQLKEAVLYASKVLERIEEQRKVVK